MSDPPNRRVSKEFDSLIGEIRKEMLAQGIDLTYPKATKKVVDLIDMERFEAMKKNKRNKDIWDLRI